MKKLIAVVLGLAVMVSSVNVQASSTSKMILGIGGALIVGGLLGNKLSQHDDRDDRRYSDAEIRRIQERQMREQNRRNCHNERTFYQDSYGNIRPTGQSVRVCERSQNNNYRYNY